MRSRSSGQRAGRAGRVDGHAPVAHRGGGLAQERGRIGRLAVDGAGARELEQPVGERLEPDRLLDHAVRLAAGALALGQGARQQLRVALERGQRVADLVGQRGRHLAQAGQPALLLEAALEPLAVQDPAEQGQRDEQEAARGQRPDGQGLAGGAAQVGRHARLELEHESSPAGGRGWPRRARPRRRACARAGPAGGASTMRRRSPTAIGARTRASVRLLSIAVGLPTGSPAAAVSEPLRSYIAR